MYDMYRYEAYEPPFNSRASRQELVRWEDQGAEPGEPADYRNARMIEVAERAAAMDSLGYQVAANAIVRQTTEVQQL